jgi:hypothetical protein
MPTTEAEARTLADILEELGGISPQRIRFRPAPGTATEEDVIRIHNRENRLFELVDGILVEKAMGYWESALAIELAFVLQRFIKPRKLGALAGADGMLLLVPRSCSNSGHLIRYTGSNRAPPARACADSASRSRPGDRST